jgi:hypothetical protein
MDTVEQIIDNLKEEIKTLKEQVEKLTIERDEALKEERESCVICREEFDLKSMVNLHHDWDGGVRDECVRKFFLDCVRPIFALQTLRKGGLGDLCIFSDCECTAMYCVPCLGTLHRRSVEPIKCAVCRQ